MDEKKKRKALVKVECVNDAKQKLAELGKNNADMISKRAAIRTVKTQIKAARARGASWAEIIETMSAAGIEISLRTLKTEVESGNEKVAKQGSTRKPKQVKQAENAAPLFDTKPGSSAQFEIKPDRTDI